MDSYIESLAEGIIRWVDDRFGRAAAWIVSILVCTAITVGIGITIVALASYSALARNADVHLQTGLAE
jgi:multisubunit Na+/H+ antiporter MnhC subunit